MKVFKQAPLPFQGQKRNYLKAFKEKLREFPSSATYVDLFGGSGLLSHTVKSVYPDSTVIYNDFDNYKERLDNVDKTNVLLNDIRFILKDYPRSGKITGDIKTEVINRIGKESGFVDWRTISGSLLFAMNYAYSLEQFEKQTLYNRVRKSNYKCDGYLEGVNIVSKDYKILHEEYNSKNNVVYLVDPPYLSTDTGSYKNYWRLTDYLDILTILDGAKYFYFTSNKSQVIELCNWIGNQKSFRDPFEGSQSCSMNAKVTYNTSYEDIMVAKK